MSRVRFIPQAWVHDNAIDVDPEGTTEWDAGEIPESVRSFTYEADDLRYTDNAPTWVKEWHGPFEVEIIER